MIALRGNRAGFADVKLLNKILVDISDVQLGTQIFGKPMDMPMIVAPTGTAGLTWYQGEFELAKAAAKAGVPFTLATGSNTPMEKLANEAGGRLWMQLYMWREKDLSDELVRRAARNGFEALVWTVDIGHGANREHNLRNGFATPFVLNTKSAVDMLRHPGWLANVMGRYMLNGGMPRHVNYPEGYQTKITGNVAKQKETHGVAAKRADKVGWDDVKRLRDIFPGKFLLKGIMRPDDALRAKARGRRWHCRVEPRWPQHGFSTCHHRSADVHPQGSRSRHDSHPRQRRAPGIGHRESRCAWRRCRLVRKGNPVWHGSRRRSGRPARHVAFEGRNETHHGLYRRPARERDR